MKEIEKACSIACVALERIKRAVEGGGARYYSSPNSSPLKGPYGYIIKTADRTIKELKAILKDQEGK